MSDTEIRMMRYTIEQLSTELRATKQYVSDTESKLERTKKQLKIAVDALKYANKCIKGGCVNWETEIDKALEQITALEQKEE